jgi:hypothetical protein
MATKRLPPKPERPRHSVQEKRADIQALETRIREVEAFDPSTVTKRFASNDHVNVLKTAIDETLADVLARIRTTTTDTPMRLTWTLDHCPSCAPTLDGMTRPKKSLRHGVTPLTEKTGLPRRSTSSAATDGRNCTRGVNVTCGSCARPSRRSCDS